MTRRHTLPWPKLCGLGEERGNRSQGSGNMPLGGGRRVCGKQEPLESKVPHSTPLAPAQPGTWHSVGVNEELVQLRLDHWALVVNKRPPEPLLAAQTVP